MADGASRLVEDLGQGNFRVTSLPGSPAIVFQEAVDDSSALPAPADRPEGWTIYNRDTNGVVVRGAVSGAAAWVSPVGQVEQSYSGSGSFQPVAVDLTLAAGAGATLPDTDFLAAMMGNLLGDSLTKAGNYLAGVIGALSVTGVKAAKMGVAALSGIIMDGVTDADAAVLATIDGDSAVTKARAAFGVHSNNSVPGSGFDFGLDLKGAAHDGFSVLTLLKAALRLDNDVTKMTGSGVPVDGVAGTGAGFAGPGAEYTDITGANLYINAGTMASPTWKLVTRAA